MCASGILCVCVCVCVDAPRRGVMVNMPVSQTNYYSVRFYKAFLYMCQI